MIWLPSTRPHLCCCQVLWASPLSSSAIFPCCHTMDRAASMWTRGHLSRHNTHPSSPTSPSITLLPSLQETVQCLNMASQGLPRIARSMFPVSTLIRAGTAYPCFLQWMPFCYLHFHSNGKISVSKSQCEHSFYPCHLPPRSYSHHNTASAPALLPCSLLQISCLLC